MARRVKSLRENPKRSIKQATETYQLCQAVSSVTRRKGDTMTNSKKSHHNEFLSRELAECGLIFRCMNLLAMKCKECVLHIFQAFAFSAAVRRIRTSLTRARSIQRQQRADGLVHYPSQLGLETAMSIQKRIGQRTLNLTENWLLANVKANKRNCSLTPSTKQFGANQRFVGIPKNMAKTMAATAEIAINVRSNIGHSLIIDSCPLSTRVVAMRNRFQRSLSTTGQSKKGAWQAVR